MDAGHADIVEMLDRIAHQFRGDDSLFGDWNVAGSGGDDRDDTFAVSRWVFLKDNGAGQ